MEFIRKLIPTLFVLSLSAIISRGQETTAIRDTLRPARITTVRPAVRDAGTRVVSLPELRTMVSATGDADVIKFIQTLPGISTGAESSSAIYVRGGNLGNNVTTLDGVPVYGGSHLLGLTSALPSDIISEAGFRLGGFRGDESNATSSHLGLITADGSFNEPSFSASLSTFMIGGTVSMPLIKDKISLIGSVRISPIGPAFKAIQSIIGGALDSLSRTKAVAFDAFAKAKWLIDSDNNMSLSVYGSKDGYSYRYAGRSDEKMGWDNLIVNARHEGNIGQGWVIRDGLSFNHFSNQQGMVRDMNGTENNLAIVSSLDEITADAIFSHPVGLSDCIRLGIKERFAWFNPGTSSTFKGDGPLQRPDSPRSDHLSHSSITTIHGEWNMTRKRIELMASARLNAYVADEAENSKWKFRINPEASLLAKVNIAEWMAVEATADFTAQYYHTLEGIPMGWSVDLLVPTSTLRPPELARQFYLGIFSSFGNHRITLGAYDKYMDGLIYFSDASQLFSSAIAGWSNNIKVGSGTSRGLECSYEKVGKKLNWRLAYTLSKTDRTFEGINDGNSFPAKFDRRHILNAAASIVLADGQKCKTTLTGLFTFQSGHWESVAAGEYPAVTLFDEGYSIDYYSTLNNYSMPDYIRLDLGCNFSFKTRNPQELHIGVYNVLNRHNPFSIIYDDRSREWRQISLIPIMPSFSYHIRF